MNHDSAINILAHHTDGGGLSNHVFAVMYLLGIKFQPRISSPNDRSLYAFEAKGRYGSLTPFMGERLDRTLIEAMGRCNALLTRSEIASWPRLVVIWQKPHRIVVEIALRLNDIAYACGGWIASPQENARGVQI